MGEVRVDALQLRVLGQVLEQLLAHPHQGGGPAGSQVQTPDQFLPSRLGHGVERVKRLGSGVLAQTRDNDVNLAFAWSEVFSETLQEMKAHRISRSVVACKKGLSQCN